MYDAHTQNTWTDDRVTMLKKLWADGLSAAQIAGELGGGLSRNGVIGKVHRLGLSGRISAGSNLRRNENQFFTPPVMRMVKLHKQPVFGGPIVNELKIVEYKTAPDLQALNAAIPPEQRCALQDLTDETCRWPIGDPCEPDFHFCGGAAKSKEPYCSGHMRIAYEPSPARRRRNSSPAPANYLSGPGAGLKAFIA